MLLQSLCDHERPGALAAPVFYSLNFLSQHVTNSYTLDL